MIKYTGTNICGGDSVWQDWSGATPVSGTHYLFVTTTDIDYLMKKGCNVFRVLFGWEAMQPSPLGPIPSIIPNHATYFNKFKAVVDYATGKGATVIIDIHDGNDADFAAYYGNTVGGSYQGNKVADLLTDLWKKMAYIFKGNPNVAIGVTNEPHDISTAVWFPVAQQIIDGIRSVGSTAMIVMPGTDWTGAGSWTTDGNSNSWNIKDPLNNTAVQVHLYADANSGGGDTSIVSATILRDRMVEVTNWARLKGLKVFVAEVGISAANSLAPAAWKNFVDFCNANSDIILGFTFWSYGPPFWWSGYQFSLCPTNNYTVDSAQMKMIQSSLVGATPIPVDPQIAVLQAQVASLTAKINAAKAALT